MVKTKSLPTDLKPYPTVHQLLKSHGFRKTGPEHDMLYHATLLDSSTQEGYRLMIPVLWSDQSEDFVKLGNAYIEEAEMIPISVIRAAESKITEIADYLRKE